MTTSMLSFHRSKGEKKNEESIVATGVWLCPQPPIWLSLIVSSNTTPPRSFANTLGGFTSASSETSPPWLCPEGLGDQK